MNAPAFQHGLASCPGCDAPLAAPFAAAGRSVTCKCCGTRFVLPPANDLFESAVAYLLDHDDQPEDQEQFESAIPQIQHDTMVRSEPETNNDPVWLG